MDLPARSASKAASDIEVHDRRVRPRVRGQAQIDYAGGAGELVVEISPAALKFEVLFIATVGRIQEDRNFLGIYNLYRWA